jgi:hypothetical protein
MFLQKSPDHAVYVDDVLIPVKERPAFQALMLQGHSRRRSTSNGRSGALEISDTIAQ